ncbi:leiomodin-2a [Centroberyx gerrardi]
MSTFGYRRELGKYEEVDEDELLATLSSEELQELERELADLDPDDNVPIGLRQKDQTAKTSTGGFDREALLKYWEEENKKLLEEEKVDSGAGRADAEERRRDKSRVEQLTASDGDAGRPKDNERKKIFQKGKKVDSRFGKNAGPSKEDEEEKKDKCKKEAFLRTKGPQKTCNGLSKGSGSETRKEISRTETTDQNLNETSDRPSGNPIVIDKALEQILRDDPTMSELNLNNIEDISQETLLRFAEALCTNTHVRVFSLANTHADDRVAFAVSKMLRENRSIKNLNIESNFVSGQGILALLASLQQNVTLVELRFQNQRHICGGKVEMEMVRLLRENTTLLKLGYQFDLPGPRMTATGILTRNQDQQRQRRLQQQKEQSPPEASVTPAGQVSGSSANRPKKPSQSSKTVENQNKHPPPPPPPPPPPCPSLEPLSEKKPTRTIAEMVKQHQGSNGTKGQSLQRKPKSKKVKNGANEKESADILKELKNALKPSVQKRREEPSRPLAPQRSSRDDLMAAIRGSSIGSLKRVDLPQS